MKQLKGTSVPEDRAAALQAKYIQVFGAPHKANSRSSFGKSEFEIFCFIRRLSLRILLGLVSNVFLEQHSYSLVGRRVPA